MRFRNIVIALFLLALSATLFSETISIVRKVGGFTRMQACQMHNGNLYILDLYNVIVFNPYDGTFPDTLYLSEYSRGIAFAGDMAVVAGLANLYLVDISDPHNLVLLDTEPHGGTSGWDVAVNGNMVYFAVQNEVAIYEISGTSLNIRGHYTPISSFPMARAVAIKDTTMYVGLGDDGIVAVNVTNPATPSVRMIAPTPGSTLDLKIEGDILVCADGAYVGVDTGSVWFFNIPNSTTMTTYGHWGNLTSDCITTALVGGRLALADGEGGVRILDYTDPYHPYQVVRQPTVGDVKDVFVSADTIFAAGTDTLYIMTTDAFERDTTVVPPSVYLVIPPWPMITACNPTFTWLYTAGSNPVDPTSIVIQMNGVTYTSASPEVTFSDGSISIVSSPTVTGDTVIATFLVFNDIEGHHATGIPLSATITYWDLPPAISSIHPGPFGTVHPDSVVITGQLMSIAGIDPESLRVTVCGISYSTAGDYLIWTAPNFVCSPMGSYVFGDTIDVCVHAADGIKPEDCGPNVLDTCWMFTISNTGIGEAPLPEAIALSASPNPFNSSVRIFVGARHAVPVQIEIYDVAGKRVATPCGANAPLSPLSRGTDTNAKHESQGVYVWQPEENIPSGVYLVRAKIGNSETTKRVVYLK